jgi:hypothetical protein
VAGVTGVTFLLFEVKSEGKCGCRKSRQGVRTCPRITEGHASRLKVTNAQEFKVSVMKEFDGRGPVGIRTREEMDAVELRTVTVCAGENHDEGEWRREDVGGGFGKRSGGLKERPNVPTVLSSVGLTRGVDERLSHRR